MESKPPHMVILPSPGMGHLIPMVEFAKKLHHLHGIATTFLIPTDGPLPKAHHSFLSAVDHILLPPVSFHDLSADVNIETRICFTVTRSLPSIHGAVKSLRKSKKVVAFVVDLFGTDAFDVASEFDIPSYIFQCSTAMALCLFLHLPELEKTVSCEFREVPEKLQIPGCIPIHGKDLPDPLLDRKDDSYKLVLHHLNRYRLAHGVLLNSFKELEPGPIEALQKEDVRPVVYPIGPLTIMGSKESTKDDDLCVSLTWLDDQPSGSVLYVSFGSGGTLSHDQIIELALGLEMSEERFLWVLRCPNDTTCNAAYFNIENLGDPLAYLPPGFLERSEGRGLVVPMWAPQAQVLAHESVGAFLTHCGWNSILESVVNGVPMIAWPLYAEQRMNAVMLHEDIKVALRPQFGENGFVGRVEIANIVKGLMEGEEGKGILTRIRALKDAAANAPTQNGSSTKLLRQMVSKWKTI